MRALDRCLSLRRRLNEIDEKIELLQFNIDSPRSSVISDMPKGGGPRGNPLEEYVIKLEELENKRKRINAVLVELFKEVCSTMAKAGIDDQAREMMKYRFYHGQQWKACAVIMNKKYPQSNWNVNKCFRVYRAILCKINKNGM